MVLLKGVRVKPKWLHVPDQRVSFDRCLVEVWYRGWLLVLCDGLLNGFRSERRR